MLSEFRQPSSPKTRTGGINFPDAHSRPLPGHADVAHHWGISPLQLRSASGQLLYEEYHPYGTTAYWSAASGIEVSQRRYRYTGKEKDEETGLYYHGARYYAPWLGRWTSSDPIGLGGGINPFAYVSGNPIKLSDPSGTTEYNPYLPFGGGGREGAAAVKNVIEREDAKKAAVKKPQGAHASPEGRSRQPAEKPPCPTCHGEYGAPLPRANVGDDPVITTYAVLALILGSVLGADSGTGPSAEERRAAVAAFDENPDSTPAEAEALPTRVNPTAEAVVNVVALKGPGVLAKTVARGAEADAALARTATAFDTSRAGVGPAFDPAKLARIERNLTAEGFTFESNAAKLEKAGADAAYIVSEKGGPGTFLFGPNPTRGEVIEELAHAGQHRKAGFPGERVWGESRVSREMQTQVRMWNLAEKKKWTPEERKAFEAAWKHWQQFQGQ